MVKNWIFYILGVICAVVFHAFYYGWYSWFVLTLLICLPLFSLLVSIPAMLRMQLQLELPAACHRQEQLYLSLQGSCGWLPMPKCHFRLITENTLTGQSVSVRQKLPCTHNWYVRVDTSHCGLVTCRVDRSRVYDYLGLFWAPIKRRSEAAVCVYPVPAEPSPMPNLSQFTVRQRRPKPGGGFAEEHELRDYRPGDNLRDVHWKLSAKTDRLTVREAQEPVTGRALLTLDLCGTPEEKDSILSQLDWLSRWLTEHETVHQILWIDPSTCRTVCAQIEAGEDLHNVLGRLCSTAAGKDVPSLALRRFGGAFWRYHLQPQEETP